MIEVVVETMIDDDAAEKLERAKPGERVWLGDIQVRRLTSRWFGVRTEAGFVLDETSFEWVPGRPSKGQG